MSSPQPRLHVYRGVTDRDTPSRALHPAWGSWKWEALHDALTGIANRRLLDQRLAEALRAQHRGGLPAAVLFVDLDGFGLINRREGHRAGDLLLCLATERLCETVGAVDQVARVGGDEFVVVLEEATAGSAVTVAERVR